MAIVILITVLSIIGMFILAIFFPRLKIGKFSISTFYIPVLIGAIIILAFSLVDFNELKTIFISKSDVNPLFILTLFLSMTFLSIVLDESGFFSYIALLIIKKAKTKQLTLFIYLFLLVSVLTIFTSNDIIILTLTPFIIYFCKRVKIDPIPYLILEFISANTFSMLLLIGNPTNIYLSLSFNINFIDYLKTMAIPALFGGLVAFGLLLLIFYKKLNKPLEECESENVIINKNIMIPSLIFLVSTILLLSISSFLNIPMYLVTLIAAILLIIYLSIYSIFSKDAKNILFTSLKRLPYSLIPFLLSMFVIVFSLKDAEVVTAVSKFLTNIESTFAYGISSFLTCNILNNIPMSILFSEIIKANTNITQTMIYSSIIGSNIGAYLTPIGALAGIMFLSIIKSNDIKLSFARFSFYGLIISIPTLLISLLALFLETKIVL